MSKSVMLSIQPKWCELIASGKKTIEVRKTEPKIDVPFKCYIYCTYGNALADLSNCQSVSIENEVKKGIIKRYALQEHKINGQIHSTCAYGNGRVIGEFICDRIEKINCCVIPYSTTNNLGYECFIDNGVYKIDTAKDGVVFERQDNNLNSMLNNTDFDKMCVTPNKVFDYIGGYGKNLFLWRITDLKIYDKPKELGEFGNDCKKADWKGSTCMNSGCEHFADSNNYDYPPECRYDGFIALTKPPQSWCYVMEG